MWNVLEHDFLSGEPALTHWNGNKHYSVPQKVQLQRARGDFLFNLLFSFPLFEAIVQWLVGRRFEDFISMNISIQHRLQLLEQMGKSPTPHKNKQEAPTGYLVVSSLLPTKRLDVLAAHNEMVHHRDRVTRNGISPN